MRNEFKFVTGVFPNLERDYIASFHRNRWMNFKSDNNSKVSLRTLLRLRWMTMMTTRSPSQRWWFQSVLTTHDTSMIKIAFFLDPTEVFIHTAPLLNDRIPFFLLKQTHDDSNDKNKNQWYLQSQSNHDWHQPYSVLVVIDHRVRIICEMETGQWTNEFRVEFDTHEYVRFNCFTCGGHLSRTLREVWNLSNSVWIRHVLALSDLIPAWQLFFLRS